MISFRTARNLTSIAVEIAPVARQQSNAVTGANVFQIAAWMRFAWPLLAAMGCRMAWKQA